MKRRVLEVVLLLVLVGVVVTGARHDGEVSPSIVGTWVVDAEGPTTRLEFTADGFVNVQMSGSGLVHSIEVQGKYTTRVSPNEDGVLFLALDAPDEEPVRTIAKFETDDILLVQDTNTGEPRPTAFNDRAERLNRVSE